MKTFKNVQDKIIALELLKSSGRIDELNDQLLTELKELLLLTQPTSLPTNAQILEIAELRTDNRGEQISFLHGAIYIRDVVLGR